MDMQTKNITVLGAGTWGIALARVLSNAGHSVAVWSALDEEIDELNKTRKHKNLPQMQIPEGLKFEKDLKAAVHESQIIIIAVPSPYVRDTSKNLKTVLDELDVKENPIVVTVAKGMEKGTLYTMSEIIHDEMGNDIKVVALSGPTHAEEVAVDMPTLIVSACEDEEAAIVVQNLFNNTCIRAYTNTDIYAVELCGAMKNAEALAVGIAVGLGFGDNTKAAIITRGMAEIKRLGAAMNCNESTFAGLAGIGDLIVTATSMHSRNNKTGLLIGQGMSAKEAVDKVGMVVEGINVLPAALELAAKYNVEIPIINTVNDIVNNGKDPLTAVEEILSRKLKKE